MKKRSCLFSCDSAGGAARDVYKRQAVDRQPPAVLRLVTEAGMPSVRCGAEVADPAVAARDAEDVYKRQDNNPFIQDKKGT